MRERHLERMHRVATEAQDGGLDAVDRGALTGPVVPHRLRSDAARTTRPSSCSGPAAAPLLLVPELERPLAAASPVGDALELVGVARRRRSVRGGGPPASGRRAASRWATGSGPRTCSASSSLRPTSASSPASPVLGRLRAVKDGDELAALRRAGRGADESFRADLPDAVPRDAARKRSPRISQNSWCATVMSAQTSRSSRAARTEPHRTTSRADARSCRATRSCSTSAGSSAGTSATPRARSWWGSSRRGSERCTTSSATPKRRRWTPCGPASRPRRSTGRRAR